MANLNNTTTTPVIDIATGEPLAQRFIDDPALYALAREEDCTDMTDADLADMDEWVAWQMEMAATRVSVTGA